MLTLLFLAAILAVVALVRPMADQSAAALRKTRPRSGYNSYPIANGVTVYPGMLCQLESGYLNHWDDGTKPFLGIVLGDALGISPGSALTGNTSASPVPQARVDESGVTLMHVAVGGTVNQGVVGNLVFCADSNVANITMTDTTHPPIGRLIAYRSASDCDVELFSAQEHYQLA